MEIEEEVKNIVEKNPLSLATSDKKGNPNISVAAYAKVLNDKIIVTNNYMKTTIDNLKVNPKISVAVWNENWKGYKITGNAEYSEDDSWMEFVKSIKENQDEPCNGAIIIKPLEINPIG